MGSHWVYIIQCNDSKSYEGVSYVKNVKICCVYNATNLESKSYEGVSYV
jgi:hypothetical protein